eukprot:Mrub_05412.p1 GENE.Mrub_05412~~Mrub_05412.p1  ORF type:complete len:377 (+),score=62.71 Mrub_05412:3-1133(+)
MILLSTLIYKSESSIGYMVSGYANNITQIWNIRTGNVTSTLNATNPVLSLHSAKCGSDLTLATKDKTYYLSNEFDETYIKYDSEVDIVEIDPTNSHLVVVNKQRQIEVYNTQIRDADKYLYHFRNKDNTVRFMKVSWPYEKMVVAWSDNSCKIYDLKLGYEGYVVGSIPAKGTISAISTVGKYVGVASTTDADKDKSVVDVYMGWGEYIKSYSNHDSVVTKLYLSERYIASGDVQGKVHINKVINNDDTHVEIQESGEIVDLLITPDEEFVFTGTENSVTQWRIEDGKEIRKYISGEGKKLNTIAFSECTNNGVSNKYDDDYIYQMLVENILKVKTNVENNDERSIDEKIEDSKSQDEETEQKIKDELKKELLFYL